MRSLFLVQPLFLALFPACPVPPPANPITDGAAMEARLAGILASAGTFRAEARAEQVTERGPVKGRVYVFLRPPDHLRFDSMSPVDTPVAVLVSDGVDFALHDVGADRYYFGPADPCNIARLLRMALPGDAVVRILLGLPPRLDAVSSSVEWDGDGYYVYTRHAANGVTQTSRIAPLGQALDTILVRASDEAGGTWEVSFEDRRDIEGYRLPGHIRFASGDSDGPVDLWYLEAEVGVDLPDDAWTYPPPPGIPAEEVDCSTVIEAPSWEEVAP